MYHAICGEARGVIDMAFLDDAPGNSHYSCARGNFLDDHCVGPDASAIADGKSAQDLRSGSDHDTAAQGGMALGAAIKGGAAERYALVDGAAVTDLCGLADDDAHAVVDEDATADLRPGMDLDARQPAAELGDEPPQPAQTAAPEPVRHLVDVDGVQTRVAGQNFPCGARRRVTLEDAGDIAAQFSEHGRHLKLTDCFNPLFSRAF